MTLSLTFRRWLLLGIGAAMFASLAVLLGVAVKPAGAQDRWEGVIEIDVPFRDEDSDGTNDYTHVFTIPNSRTSAASTDSPSGSCPTAGSAQAQIGGAGATQADGNQLLARLVLPVRYAADCTLSFEFPASVESGVTGVNLTTTDTSVNVSASSPIAAATYTDGRTTFESNVTFNGFDAADAGLEFSITYRNHHSRTLSHAACTLHSSQRTETYEVGATGAVTRTSDPAPLINSPAGTSDTCRYTIGWPDVPGYDRDDGSSSTVRASTPNPSATYSVPAETTFAPQLDLRAPFVDFNDNDQNDFYWVPDSSGGESSTVNEEWIKVTFTAVEGPIADCSPTTSIDYDLAPAPRTVDGETLATFTHDPFTLISTPRGKLDEYCGYQLSFRNANGVNESRWAFYILIEDLDTDDYHVDGEEIGSRSDRARATFTTKRLSGSGPRLRVSGPSTAAGKRLDVTMTSDQDGCTSSVDPDPIIISSAGTGNVPPSSIIMFPQGYTEPSDFCTYQVNWPEYENRAIGTAPTIIFSGASADFTAYTSAHQFTTRDTNAISNGNITATYEEYSSFIPSILIHIPRYDSHTESGSFFDTPGAGRHTHFPIRIAPKTSSPAGCSADDTYNYRIISAGTILPAGLENPVLTNVPANQPGGATDPCVYDVTFPDPVNSAQDVYPAWTLRLDGAAMGEIQASSHRLDRNYEHDTINLDVIVDIDVPQYNADGTTNNAFATSTFTIDIAPQSGAHEDCTPALSRAFSVDNMGDVTGATISLVDRPQGETGLCRYDVTLPPTVTPTSGAPTLNRASGFTTTISGGSRTISADYHTNFDAPFDITVTQYDADGTTTNAFSGSEIVVGVAPQAAAPAAGCTTGDTTFTVNDEGDVVGTLTFADGIAGEATRCSYTVSFPQNEDGGTDLIRSGTQDRTVEAATAAFTVAYEGAASMFTPDTSISVPYIDASGANALANQMVEVSYSVVAAPAQHANCTTGPLTEQWTIAATGSRNAGGDITRGTPASLVDRPQGQTARCRYTASVTASLPLPGGDTVTLAAGSNNQEVAADMPVMIVYVGDTFITPAITITVPPYLRDGVASTNYYEGTTFDVTYAVKAGAGPPSDCSTAETQTYTIDANGDATLTAGSPTLVDVPRVHTASCVYVATFAPSASSAPGAAPVWTLRNQGAATADVTAGSVAVTRVYAADEITYAPTIAITVPQVRGLNVGTAAGDNLFAGQTFAVSVVREAGSHADCSLAQSTSLSYTVAAGGTVAAARAEPALATLVDRPAGENDRCNYTVMFDRSRSSTPGAELSWRLTPDAQSVTLTGAAPVATGAYAAADITYFPDAAISVPTYSGDEDDPATPNVDESQANAFVALKVDVVFASTPTECVDATLAFTVQPDSSVAPDDPSATLVAYPAGMETLCTYAVTFPDNETTGMRLELQSGWSTSVSGVAQAIAAQYLAAQTTFVPDIEVVVPFIDSDPADEMNDLAELGEGDSDRRVTVTYAPEAGSPENCSTETETYQIGAARDEGDGRGRAVRTAPAVMLVDRPAGVDERCTYEMTVEEAETLVDELPVRSFDPNTPIRIEAIERAVQLSYAARSLPAPLRPGADTLTKPLGVGPSGIGTDVDAEAFVGFVAVAEPRLAAQVMLSLSGAQFASGDTVEVLLSSPGACGTDLAAFGGVPASVGLAYAMAAEAGDTWVVAEGAHSLSALAERTTDGVVEQEPCVLRVTVLAAPTGCVLDDASVDDAGRSYVSQAWSEGAAAFDLTPSFSCGPPEIVGTS